MRRRGPRRPLVAATLALCLSCLACSPPEQVAPAPPPTPMITATPTPTVDVSPSARASSVSPSWSSPPAVPTPSRAPATGSSGSSSATARATRTTAPRTGEPTAGPPRTAIPPSPTGGVRETVAAKKESTRPPVPLDQAASAKPDVVVAISEVRQISARAQVPGEVGGPAVSLRVSVTNQSGEPAPLDQAVVALTDARGNPGQEMSADPARPVTGVLPPGEAADGVYVFTVDPAHLDPVTVTVTLAGETPVLLFRGDVT